MLTSTYVPELKNKIVQFLKQNAGFENTPCVDVVEYNDGFKVMYSSLSTTVSAYGENFINAYEDFTDKWSRFHTVTH